MPKWLAEITLLSYVPPLRAILTFSFAACLLSIWFIAYIWREDVIPIWYKFILLAVNAWSYFYAITHSKMDNYFSDFETIAVAVLGTVILAFALFGWRRLFYLAFAALVIVSGFSSIQS